MKVILRLLVGAALGVALIAGVAAQDKAPASGTMPRVLVVQREFVKPGKAGAIHEKSESAFVQAMSRAKWPTHYLAMQAMSGKPRVLFFISYPSFETWEQDTNGMNDNPALAAAMDRANEADGALLDSTDQNVFTYNEEFSLHPMTDISKMRYMEIWVAHVRPGHDKEWSDAVKMAKAGNEKAIPTNHWAAFENAYGMTGGTYLFLTARKSMAEVDRAPQEEKAFEAALGEDGMKKLTELFGAAVESSETQIFAFSPHLSYPPDEWVKADPDFWHPKPAAGPAAKAEKKPAAKP